MDIWPEPELMSPDKISAEDNKMSYTLVYHSKRGMTYILEYHTWVYNSVSYYNRDMVYTKRTSHTIVYNTKGICHIPYCIILKGHFIPQCIILKGICHIPYCIILKGHLIPQCIILKGTCHIPYCIILKGHFILQCIILKGTYHIPIVSY